MRIGTGFDAHMLVEGRPLILGGVTVPFEYGLLGHSDADVLIHAIMDAILGALALGDIGKHFPDTDPAYKGISSMELLKRVIYHCSLHGYTVENIDSVIIAQKPKLAPYIEQMRETIARTINLDISRIGIKATTTEGMGFTGTGEGIAAHAVTLLSKL